MIRISVIIPVFNGRSYLRKAVVSALTELSQLEPQVGLAAGSGDSPSHAINGSEVIVVDDGSSDGALETIDGLPVKIVSHESNRGVAAARNTGVEASEGEFVVFLDSDDLFSSQSLQWRLDWMATHPSYEIVGGIPAGVVDERGAVLPKYLHVLHPQYAIPSFLSIPYFQEGGHFPVANWLFLYRRSLLDKIGSFDESLRIGEDCDYLFRVMEALPIPIQPKPVVYRRLHSGNISLAQKGGDPVLSDETIKNVAPILARYGIHPSQWPLWETSYGLGNERHRLAD